MTQTMKIGVMIFATDQTVPMHRLAPAVEEHGFESLWVTEKTHVPSHAKLLGLVVNCQSGTSELVIRLSRSPAAAATTTTLRVGTGVALLALRDPVITAKTIATLDWQSNGRVELGVGYGWNREECATHGVALDTARERLIEHLSLMETLWANDEGAFRGEYCNVEPAWSWPKPVQQPRPPIHLGTRASTEAFNDIAQWADGWIPIEGYGDIAAQVPRLRNAFERNGRDPGAAIVTVYSSQGDRSVLDTYQHAGVDRVVVWLPPADEPTVLDALDTHAQQLGELVHA